MDHAVVVRGHLTGRHIELEEPAGNLQGEVEVIVRVVAKAQPPRPDILDVLNSLKGGTRTKDEIDQQLAAERAEWDERGGRLPRRLLLHLSA